MACFPAALARFSFSTRTRRLKLFSSAATGWLCHVVNHAVLDRRIIPPSKDKAAFILNQERRTAVAWDHRSWHRRLVAFLDQALCAFASGQPSDLIQPLTLGGLPRLEFLASPFRSQYLIDLFFGQIEPQRHRYKWRCSRTGLLLCFLQLCKDRIQQVIFLENFDDCLQVT